MKKILLNGLSGAIGGIMVIFIGYQTGNPTYVIWFILITILVLISFKLGFFLGKKKERAKPKKEIKRANIPSTNIKPPVDIKNKPTNEPQP